MLAALQREWLGALSEQRERIRSLHTLVVQLNSVQDVAQTVVHQPRATLHVHASRTDGADACMATDMEAKYKHTKHLLRVQAQHVTQLQGALPRVLSAFYSAVNPQIHSFVPVQMKSHAHARRRRL